MVTLKRLLLINILILASHLLHSQSTVNIFDTMINSLRETGFTDELEHGNFKEIWGQSIDDLAVEIAKLNLQFYEITNNTIRENLIREYLGSITLPALNYIFLPYINGISLIDHEYGTNRIALSGGYIILSYFIALSYSYDQYCQINEIDNELRLSEFNSALSRIIQQNWSCERDSLEYKEFLSFMRLYDRLYDMSEAEKNSGNILFSLDDYFLTNFQLLVLYLYAHELSHIVLKHNIPVNATAAEKQFIEIEADMSAAIFIFTRIKGGWGVETDNGKVASIIEPLLRLLEFITELYPAQMENRLSNFMRRYLWVESFYANGIFKIEL